MKFSNTKNRKYMGTIIVALLGTSTILYSPWGGSAEMDPYLRPDTVPTPADNQISPARAELGKMLFFDPRLSGSNWISCATCHNPAFSWTDRLPTATGANMKALTRATPTILNTAYNRVLMWDGRAPNLEAQATIPITAPDEMNQDMDELVQELSAIPGYKTLF